MDDRRFDELARTLTKLAPRRAVVRSLTTGTIAGLAAALAGLTGSHSVEAGKGKKKKKKGRRKKKGGGGGTRPQCVTANDCCPASRPTCDTDSTVYGVFRQCAAGGVCQCPDNYPAYCSHSAMLPPSCHKCCSGDDCAADPEALAQGLIACNASGNCECPTSFPDYCQDYGANNRGNFCTNTLSDAKHCGCCGFGCGCNTGEMCLNGDCVTP
jgi:hypothetical protein